MSGTLKIIGAIFGGVLVIIGVILCIIPGVTTCYDENLNDTNCFIENLKFFIPAFFLFLIGAACLVGASKDY